MHSEPRAAFLLVRRLQDMQSANDELAAYLSILRRISPTQVRGAIQGIWVDDEGVANLPSTLLLQDSCGERCTVRILETMGINGIWMLCWLEAAANTISRIDLIAALLERFDHEVTDSAKIPARFIPVFPSQTSNSTTRLEMHALEARYPGLVLAPGYLHEDGSLFLSQMQPYNKGQSV